MDIQTIKQNFDLLSLVQGQVALRKSGAYHIGPCPFCGGVDRFTIKHTDRGDRWHCRGCGGDQYHSVIDFVMRRDGISFLEAVKSLGGGNVPNPLRGNVPNPLRGDVPNPLRGDVPNPLRGTTPGLMLNSRSDQVLYPTSAPRFTTRSASLPTEGWQEKGRDFVLRASEALLNDTKASIAKAYLEARGLERGTWLRGLLGYAQVYDPKLKVKRPAVCIPHLDGKLFLSAVKYRFCDPNNVGRNPRGLRYTSHKGSRPLLYGLDGLLPMHHSLLVVEGELNQLSLLQVISKHWRSQPGISVVSTGSEGLNPSQVALLRQVARPYQQLIVWMDKAAVTREVARLIQLPCRMLCSPKGLDANDLLQAGLLWRYLEGAVLT
jgi:hypothetical protein